MRWNEIAELARRVAGPVRAADQAADLAGYDDERRGFDLAADHRPTLTVGAATEADVVAAIRFAAEQDLPVGLQATGHGANRAMDTGLLINTRRLVDVRVDPVTATARVAAGATSGAVIAAAAPHGLAPVAGAAPAVGFVSYTLGGGLGLLGRPDGYAADHVRRLEVVTADGRELAVTADQYPDLFWGLRGGGGAFAAVTALEINLVPVTSLYGGGLFFDGEQAPPVVEALARCLATAPDQLSLSIAFVTFPNRPTLPLPLRGRFCCHVRVAYVGDASRGERLIAALRTAAPFLDTVRVMPFTDMGTIHADPAAPMPVNNDSVALAADCGQVLPAVLPFVHPTAPFLLELRHLGGALSHSPAVDNAVGRRSAHLNLFTSAYPGTDIPVAAAAQQQVYAALAAHSSGGPLRNFLPTSRPDASTCYEPHIAARLADLKHTWDPGGSFRFTPTFSSR